MGTVTSDKEINHYRNYNLRVNHEVCVGSQCRHPCECPSFPLCQYPQHHRPAGACQRRLLQPASADQQSEGFRHYSRVEKNESTVSSIWERLCGGCGWDLEQCCSGEGDGRTECHLCYQLVPQLPVQPRTH